MTITDVPVLDSCCQEMAMCAQPTSNESVDLGLDRGIQRIVNESRYFLEVLFPFLREGGRAR